MHVVSPRANHAAVLAEVLGYDRAAHPPATFLARVTLLRKTLGGSVTMCVLTISPVSASAVGIIDDEDDDASSQSSGGAADRPADAAAVSQSPPPPGPAMLSESNPSAFAAAATPGPAATAVSKPKRRRSSINLKWKEDDATPAPEVAAASRRRRSSANLKLKEAAVELDRPPAEAGPRHVRVDTRKLLPPIDRPGDNAYGSMSPSDDLRGTVVSDDAPVEPIHSAAPVQSKVIRHPSQSTAEHKKARRGSGAGSAAGIRAAGAAVASFTGGNDEFDKRSTVSSKSVGTRALGRLRYAIAQGSKTAPHPAFALRWLWWIIVALVLTNILVAAVQAYFAVGVFAAFESDREEAGCSHVLMELQD